MKNEIMIGIVVLVFGAIAGWYILGSKAPIQQSRQQPTPTVQPETSMTGEKGAISYADTGFSPQSLTVKSGTTVTFTNVSAQPMWVASDVHPTHQLLPGFDELKSVGKGESYSYTFTKVGTWTFHNHMNPSDKGTVVVTQ